MIRYFESATKKTKAGPFSQQQRKQKRIFIKTKKTDANIFTIGTRFLSFNVAKEKSPTKNWDAPLYVLVP